MCHEDREQADSSGCGGLSIKEKGRTHGQQGGDCKGRGGWGGGGRGHRGDNGDRGENFFSCVMRKIMFYIN